MEAFGKARRVLQRCARSSLPPEVDVGLEEPNLDRGRGQGNSRTFDVEGLGGVANTCMDAAGLVEVLRRVSA